MTGFDHQRQPGLRVLWVHHSAVVTAWRRGRAGALEALGNRVAVVAAKRWNEGGALVSFTRCNAEDATAVRTFGSHPFLFFFDPIALWRVMRKETFDVFDFHEEPASLALAELLLIARLAGQRAPVVCYSAQNIFKRYPWPFRMFERGALRRVAAVHSCNEQVGAVLGEKGFAGEVVNLGLGVDVERFRPPIPNSPAVRAVSVPGQDKPTDGVLRVGFVGRIEDRKGVFVLLAAVASTDCATVTFVGAGPDQRRLEEAIGARGLAERAMIEGYVSHDDLAARYRSFDVIVVASIDTPSWSEQFGRVVIEAMASGVPVIVSEAGALPEVAGDAAIVVPEHDAGALARALQELASSADLRDELRAKGLRRAIDFSWGEIASRQSALYHGVQHRNAVASPATAV